MLILFDVGVPRGLAKHLVTHIVVEARERGWDRISNGELIRTAEAAGFDLLISNDTKLEYQQNLEERRIAIIVLSNAQWPMVQLVAPKIASAVNGINPSAFTKIEVPLAPKRRRAKRADDTHSSSGSRNL